MLKNRECRWRAPSQGPFREAGIVLERSISTWKRKIIAHIFSTVDFKIRLSKL